MDTTRENVEKHLAWRADHLDGSSDKVTDPLLRALAAERDTLKALCVELVDALYRADHSDRHAELIGRARSLT